MTQLGTVAVIVLLCSMMLSSSFVFGRAKDGTVRFASGGGWFLCLINLVILARFSSSKSGDELLAYLAVVSGMCAALVASFMWVGWKSRGRKVIRLLDDYIPAKNAETVRSPDESNPVV